MNVIASIKNAFGSFLFLTLASLFAFTANAQVGSVQDFSDYAEIPSWAEEAIEELMFQGVLGGNDDGSFAPARALNRAEVSKIIILATGVDCSPSATPTFPDAQPGDWFYDYVQCMADYGWINGYPDGTFRPAVTINRAEMAKMVVNAFDLDQDLSGAPHFTDVQSSDWFYGYVETAYNTGIMQGYTATTFSPASMVTRAETARIVYDAQLYLYTDNWQPEFSEGSLQVALSPDTPAGTNIPFNATSVPYTTVDLTASADSDVEIGRITFTRLGLGDDDDFDNCWIEFDGFKVGNEKSVSTDDTVELSFNPPIIVPAGQTLVGDLVCSSQYDNTGNTNSSGSLDDRNIGHRNRFALIGPEDILSTAVNVVGDFPIEGEEMETSDYAVSQLEFKELGANTTVEVGDEFAEIGKFRLLNDSSTSKDVELRAITFENDGDAEMDEVLFDTALYVGGDQISYETIIDGDYITFRLDDGVTGGYIIEDGDSRVMSIRTDIVTAEVGDTLQFKVDNYEDIVAIEIGTSFGVRTIDENGNDAEDSHATLAEYTIDAGDLNISRDSSSPGNEEYAPGSNEVVAQVIRAVVGQPMEFDGITFQVVTGSTSADKNNDGNADRLADFNDSFDNFRLYVDDRLIDSEDDIRLATGGTDGTVSDYIVEFDTNFELAATSIIRLVMDVEDGADTGDQIKFEVTANADFDGAEYISTGDQVPTVELLGTATGSFIEVEVSKLIISKTDGFSNNDNIVAGEDDVNVLEFTLGNNESGDVNVTSIVIGGFGAGAGAVYQNYTLALFLDGVQIGSSRNMDANGTATFNDISGVVIPSSEEKEFTLVVNTIESSATSTTTATAVTSPLTGITLAKSIGAQFGNSNPAYVCLNLTAAQAQSIAEGAQITFEDTNQEVRYLIETIASPAVASGTTAFGANITPATATANTPAFTVAGTSPFNYPGTDTIAHDCPAGSYVFLTGFDQTPVATGAPVQTEVDKINQQHDMNVTEVTIGYNYVAPTAATYLLYVADATGFSVGSQVIVPGMASAALGSGNICVTAVTPGTPDTLTIADCDGTTVLTGTPTGGTVTLQGSSSTIAFGVRDVEADNVENGQEVETCEANEVLGDVFADGTEDHDCDGLMTDTDELNYLCGVSFNLVPSGTLTVTSGGTTIFSDILVADETDVEIMQIRFNAANDEIHVTDLYLENDVYIDGAVFPVAGGLDATDYGDASLQSDGSDPAFLSAFAGETADDDDATLSRASERFDFKLYSSAGVLLDTAQMGSDGKLHFNLGNANRIIVPKDDSETVSVKVNVRDINAAGETGTRLKLSLDTDTVAYRGVEAVTAATGDDIATPNYNAGTNEYGWEVLPGVVTSQDFVAYRTELTVKHASQQVQTIQPSPAEQEIYRFTVEADSAHEVYVGRLTFDISASGFYSGATGAAFPGTAPVNADFNLYEVDSSGSPDTTNKKADGTANEISVTQFGTAATGLGAAFAPPAADGTAFRVTVDFNNTAGTGEILNAGSSKTYALFMKNTANDISVTSNSNTDDYVTATIVRDNSYVAPDTLDGSADCGTNAIVGQRMFTYTTGLGLNSIIWSDAASPSHGPCTRDWLNGYRVNIDTNALPVGEY